MERDRGYRTVRAESGAHICEIKIQDSLPSEQDPIDFYSNLNQKKIFQSVSPLYFS